MGFGFQAEIWPGCNKNFAPGKLVVAEDYHQKYLLQQEGWLMTQLGLAPGEELIESSEAARLNGYVAGYGDEASFEAEVESLVLSKSVAAFVLKKIKEKANEKHDRNVFWS